MIATRGYVAARLRNAFPLTVAVKDRWILVLETYSLEAYFDESGTHAGSHNVAVAGYVSTPEQWSVFGVEWGKALQEYGLEFFHMTDFAVGAPPYDTWTWSEKEQRLSRLIGIINQHAIASVGNLIPRKHYAKHITKRGKRFMGGIYGLGAILAFLETAERLRPEYPAGQVAYIFDQGARGMGQVLKIFRSNYRRLDQRERLMLLSLTFEDKKRFVPLQAADILAYELYQHLPRFLGESPLPPRARHLNMLAQTPRSWGKLDEEGVRSWCIGAGVAAKFHKNTKDFR